MHPAVWLLLATAGMIAGATQLWDQYRYRIADPARYTITRDNVALNAAPPWFDADLYDQLYQQVFNSSTLLDQHVVPQTATHLSSIPWVQSVDHVSKHPDGLSIKLVYRHPVALVANQDRSQTMVDSQGVVFDTRLLTPLDANRMDNELLRISMPRVDLGQLQPWQNSADERIEHAARLCSFISEHASDLNLYRIVTFDLPLLDGQSSPELEIWTRNGVRVLWGSSPDREVAGEAAKSEKLKAIKAFVVHHGPLESFEAKRRQLIDVRSGIAQLVAIKRYATSDDILDSFK